MSDSMQRKCKNVISKLWRRIDKEGHQMIPNISSWWRRNENSSFRGPAGSTLDLQKIEQRVDGLEYGAVTEFIAAVRIRIIKRGQARQHPASETSSGRSLPRG
ncbi:brahma1 [Zea mays]|uniref:Brahma1 n=1 Tax=Zea mays TaxID=4577 RepID=A0A1D6GYG8_MAIZE|nr:brahma1 [Zea mays]